MSVHTHPHTHIFACIDVYVCVCSWFCVRLSVYTITDMFVSLTYLSYTPSLYPVPMAIFVTSLWAIDNNTICVRLITMINIHPNLTFTLSTLISYR